MQSTVIWFRFLYINLAILSTCLIFDIHNTPPHCRNNPCLLFRNLMLEHANSTVIIVRFARRCSIPNMDKISARTIFSKNPFQYPNPEAVKGYLESSKTTLTEP